MLSNKLYRLGAYSLILGGSAGANLFEFSGTGLATFHATSIGASQVDTKGNVLINNTAAAAGAQQYSPATIWVGKGWKTTATAASQDVRFRAYVVPVQGTANPTATWTLESSINAASYAMPLTYNSAGQMYIPTNLGVGLSSGVLATIHAKGSGATAATRSAIFTDSNGNVSLQVKDSAEVQIGNNTPNVTQEHTIYHRLSLVFNNSSGGDMFTISGFRGSGGTLKIPDLSDIGGGYVNAIESSTHLGLLTSGASSKVWIGKSSGALGDSMYWVKNAVKIPTATTIQKNAFANVAGLLLLDTTLGKLCFNTGAAWETVTSV